MGQAKRREADIGVCIYCGSNKQLSDEHVVPFALGGKLILHKASCESCRRITGAIEQRLLRKHWRAVRQRLNLPTRSVDFPATMPVDIEHTNGTVTKAQTPTSESKVLGQFIFDAPGILRGISVDQAPTGRVFFAFFGPQPTKVLIEDVPYDLVAGDKLSYPVNMDASDVARILAKIAHGYAISRKGVNACKEFFLPPFITSDVAGILTYVGTAVERPAPSGPQAFGVEAREQDGLLIVSIQLFRVAGMDTPPIYDVVVGRL